MKLYSAAILISSARNQIKNSYKCKFDQVVSNFLCLLWLYNSSSAPRVTTEILVWALFIGIGATDRVKTVLGSLCR